MILLSIVVDTDIAAGSSSTVQIGTPLPLQGVKGTVSVWGASATPPAYLDHTKYTGSIENGNTVRITVASDGTALASGDIVNIVAITEGEIARP